MIFHVSSVEITHWKSISTCFEGIHQCLRWLVEPAATHWAVVVRIGEFTIFVTIGTTSSISNGILNAKYNFLRVFKISFEHIAVVWQQTVFLATRCGSAGYDLVIQYLCLGKFALIHKHLGQKRTRCPLIHAANLCLCIWEVIKGKLKLGFDGWVNVFVVSKCLEVS